MSLATIRAGLKTNLATVFTDYTIYDYEPKSPVQNAIIIGWPDIYDIRVDQGSAQDIAIPVRFEIAWQDDESSDAQLETAMDAALAALEVDRTLGGACDDLSCAPFTDIGARTMPDDKVNITFTVPVEILA